MRSVPPPPPAAIDSTPTTLWQHPEDTLSDAWFAPLPDEQIDREPSGALPGRRPARSSLKWGVAIAAVAALFVLAFAMTRALVHEPRPIASPPVVPRIAATKPPTEPTRPSEPAPPTVAPSPPAITNAPSSTASRKARDPVTRSVRSGATTANDQAGTLAIATKPPYEIAIDGVATTLTTPQRAIDLSVGRHTVSLFDFRGIRTTFEIVIEPRKTTKIIRDFTRRESR